jgi:hypothetical protein
MSEPENVPINPFERTGWWYQEFLAAGGQKATPTTGIDAAQMSTAVGRCACSGTALNSPELSNIHNP